MTFKLDWRVALHRPEYAEENGLKNEKSIKEEKGSKSDVHQITGPSTWSRFAFGRCWHIMYPFFLYNIYCIILCKYMIRHPQCLMFGKLWLYEPFSMKESERIRQLQIWDGHCFWMAGCCRLLYQAAYIFLECADMWTDLHEWNKSWDDSRWLWFWEEMFRHPARHEMM